MKRLLSISLTVGILAIGVGVSAKLISSAPKADRERAPQALPVVEVIEVARADFPVRVHSQGTVEPLTESVLVSQVSGRIVETGPAFRVGGFFAKGELLLRMEPTDYETAIVVAEAEVARRRLELEEERARAAQAEEEWASITPQREARALHLRKPQVASAEAALRAAEASLAQARLNLQRTRIVAPYAGRVLEQNADLGQFVGVGTPLGKIFSTDAAQIRLPLTDEQQALLALAESYPESGPAGPAVTLTASIGQSRLTWQGSVVRTEGVIDPQSRQLFVVAEIADPYGRRSGQPPLRIGQFVEAEIEGRLLRDVFAIPREAVRLGREVLVVASDGKLYRRALEVVWRDPRFVVAAAGLEPGDRVSLTAIPFATDGSRVRVAGEEPEEKPKEQRRPAKES